MYYLYLIECSVTGAKYVRMAPQLFELRLLGDPSAYDRSAVGLGRVSDVQAGAATQ